jgi:hypothetical protein
MKSNRSRRIAATLGTAAGGLLAAALGMGVASADPSSDPYSWTDQLIGGLSAPAPAAAALDMQVSIDGTDLFPTAGNTAIATSDAGDIAIAIGNGANASATGGFLDFAFADGANSLAEAGYSGDFDSAVVFGANSTAEAGFDGVGFPVFPCSEIFCGFTEILPPDFDFAAVFGPTLTADAFGFFGTDIVPSL